MEKNKLYGQLEFREELLEQLVEMFRENDEVMADSHYWPSRGHPYLIEWVDGKRTVLIVIGKRLRKAKRWRTRRVCLVLYAICTFAATRTEIA